MLVENQGSELPDLYNFESNEKSLLDDKDFSLRFENESRGTGE